MLRKRPSLFAVYICLFFVLVSCKTYTVSPESFKIQLMEYPIYTQLDSTDSLFLGPVMYYAFDMEHVFVKDKKGESVFLPNGPSLECRITEQSGRRSIFYFDTMELKNDTLTGTRSFIFPSLNNRFIVYDSITHIEIQDGKKNFGQNQFEY